MDPDRFSPDVIQQLGRIDLIADTICDGLLQGVHRSRRRGFSSEFSDFKPYVAGDDTRLLDWRIWARTDRFFIRRFEAETDLELLLLLDATASMAWRWKDRISKLEYGANLIAALAAMHIRQQDRVGFLLHDAKDLHFLPPRGRKQQLAEIFALLSKIEPATTETFPKLISSLAETRRHRGRIIICSDLEEDESGILEGLDKVAALEDEVIVIHILDQAEVELPFDDVTHFKDEETGELLPINLDAMRKEHAENLKRFREFWKSHCRKGQLSYVPIHTGMNYQEAVWALNDERHYVHGGRRR